MNHDVPKSLVPLAALMAVVSFAVAMYLENAEDQWLERHPISVNLLSAFICFNVLVVFLASVLRRMRENEEVRELHEPFKGMWRAIEASYLEDVFRMRRYERASNLPAGPSGEGWWAEDEPELYEQEPERIGTWRQSTRHQFRKLTFSYIEDITKVAGMNGLDSPFIHDKIAQIQQALRMVPAEGSLEDTTVVIEAIVGELGPEINRHHMDALRARVGARPRLIGMNDGLVIEGSTNANFKDPR